MVARSSAPSSRAIFASKVCAAHDRDAPVPVEHHVQIVLALTAAVLVPEFERSDAAVVDAKSTALDHGIRARELQEALQHRARAELVNALRVVVDDLELGRSDVLALVFDLIESPCKSGSPGRQLRAWCSGRARRGRQKCSRPTLAQSCLALHDDRRSQRSPVEHDDSGLELQAPADVPVDGARQNDVLADVHARLQGIRRVARLHRQPVLNDGRARVELGS